MWLSAESSPGLPRKMIRFLYRVILLACLGAGPWAMAQMDEYSIKAGYLYNFSKYVEWPQNGPPTGHFVICIVGEDPFSGKLQDAIAGRNAADGRPLEVKRLKVLSPEALGACQIAFISKSERAHSTEIVNTFRGMPVFTVADFESFATHGGIADLRIEGTKVKVDLNMKAAYRSNLRVSGRLQQVADLVSDGGN